MADLPDYYTQAQISEAEAASIKGGLEANLPAAPVSRDIYLATDKHILYVCIADGEWTGFDAAILRQGILTLYANMVAGGYRITGLGAPTAQDDALRYGRAEIRNNEIALAAAIAYTKLALEGKIDNDDIKTGAAIAYSKLNLTGAIKAADIVAAAAIPLTKLEAAVCSETEADNKIAAIAELIATASPAAAANVEFTGLDGEIFLLFYSLTSSGDTDLQLTLNNVVGTNYWYRYFDTGTTMATATAENQFLVAGLEADRKSIGCLIIEGKQTGANARLTAGHFGAATTDESDQLINGWLLSSDGDLASLILAPAAGTITGEVKLYKVK